MSSKVRTIDTRLTRRRLLGLLALGGGSIALIACGGDANTVTVGNAPGTAAAPTLSSTAPTQTTTRASAGTAVGAATPGSAASVTPRIASPGSPSAGATADNALLRMLKLVPQRGLTVDRYGLSFADIETQKRNYGLDNLTSYAAFTSGSKEQFSRFNDAMRPLPIPEEISLQVAAGEKPNALGYTFWQMERASYAGQPRTNWLRLEGRLDTAAIRAALSAAGRTTTAYGGETIFTRGGNGAIDINDPIASTGILSTYNRATLDDGALTAAPTTATIEAGIDTRAGRAPSLADDPNYFAVATALGPVVGATVVPAEFLYHPPAATSRGTPTVTPATPSTGERLPAYSGVGMGMRDDGQTHTMVIALAYERADDARVAAPLVRRRMEDYRLSLAVQSPTPIGTVTPPPLLRELATPGAPQLLTVGTRTVVLLPLAISSVALLNLWRTMIAITDYRFLAE